MPAIPTHFPDRLNQSADYLPGFAAALMLQSILACVTTSHGVKVATVIVLAALCLELSVWVQGGGPR